MLLTGLTLQPQPALLLSMLVAAVIFPMAPTLEYPYQFVLCTLAP